MDSFVTQFVTCKKRNFEKRDDQDPQDWNSWQSTDNYLVTTRAVALEWAIFTLEYALQRKIEGTLLLTSIAEIQKALLN